MNIIDLRLNTHWIITESVFHRIEMILLRCCNEWWWIALRKEKCCTTDTQTVLSLLAIVLKAVLVSMLHKNKDQ